MDKIKVEFTKEQINNLDAFLQRVNLKGSEVNQFVSILNSIKQSLKNTKQKEGE